MNLYKFYIFRYMSFSKFRYRRNSFLYLSDLLPIIDHLPPSITKISDNQEINILKSIRRKNFIHNLEIFEIDEIYMPSLYYDRIKEKYSIYNLELESSI